MSDKRATGEDHAEELPTEDISARVSNQAQSPKDIVPSSDQDSVKASLSTVTGHNAQPSPASELPQAFGRYRIVSLLGSGGFGKVHRALDEQLQRDVAIKVTKAELLDQSFRQAFLNEARIVAALDHPNIVPVYDVGQTESGDFFVVSKLIDGADLATRIKLERPDRLLSLKIVAAIAQALHYAHQQGLVHRDVKPANILIDRSDRPYLTDFGLALRETEFGKETTAGGTPAYMSPEQARGEGHRVDNRSDIYSLGVVLYELLTGRRPFRSDNARELMSLIASEDVRTPRLFDDSLSIDLERICLKALARRPSDRFAVASDLADEINCVLANRANTPGHIPTMLDTPGSSTPAFAASGPATPVTSITPHTVTLVEGLGGQAATLERASASSATSPTRVVPKGLRSFDAEDSDFFLELLPGPFDREGLPESLRFWKTRIEQTDPERTFKVGLIYGPSGCGKSSLMKAGLLPRLSRKIIPIYLEATADDTDYRLLRAIRKAIPDSQGGSLKEVLSIIRRRKLLPTGGKLLLVLDQFEQWLYAEHDYARATLTEALLQCDGAAVQAIIMVREDFWVSVSRFLRELDIPILERENSAMVDLFDLDHAAKVLELFGAAYRKLPDNQKDWTSDQREFLRQAVEGLAEDRKVISVRLAVFADMLKSRPWTTASLREVGGIEGVGVTFLEETFASKHAPIQQRKHQEAVRGLLAALLPSTGTDIKGSMRSTDELRTAAGYDRHPRDFQELLHILDSQLRLITPTDKAGVEDKLDAGANTDDAPISRAALAPVPPDPVPAAAVPLEKPNIPSGKAGMEPTSAETGANAQRLMCNEPERLGQSLYYQLTHDYLVPSLRDWLTRKQRETKKGRADLKLAERAATWAAKPENKQLPTTLEWMQIRWHTDRRRWTEVQQKMMRTAARAHGLNWGGALAALLAIGLSVQLWVSQREWNNKREQTRVAAESLQNNLGPSIPVNIRELKKLPDSLVFSELTERFSTENPRHKLALAFALAAYGRVETDYLVSRIDDIAPDDTANFVDALAMDRDRAITALRAEAAKCETETLWRRKAKLAIAALALGEVSIAADVCEYNNRPDPGQRTLFIHEFPQWEWQLPNRAFDLSKLAQLVAESNLSGLRSGICLAVGSIPVERIRDVDPRGLEAWNQIASGWFVKHGDSSTHCAASWLLRRWQLPLPEIADQHEIRNDRDWFVNSAGMTMLRIRPPEREPIPEPVVELSDPREAYRQQLTKWRELDREQMDVKTLATRAVAYFQTGDFESALSDCEHWLANAEKTNPDQLQVYRILSLSRFERHEEAVEALEKVKATLSKSLDLYLSIQLPLYRGDNRISLALLEQAVADEKLDSGELYDAACAAALCAKYLDETDTEQARPFKDFALDLLRRAVGVGYADHQHISGDVDLAVLHNEEDFKTLVGKLQKKKLEADQKTPQSEYCVGAFEVTRGQFEQFIGDQEYEYEKPTEWKVIDKITSPTAEHPVQGLSWYDAVMYCNWLSRRESMAPAYRKTGKQEVDSRGKLSDEWELIAGSSGYRLPRDTEWEYACRAGSETRWSSGNDEDLLVDYCQMSPSKISANVGHKFPNSWGVHDMHGNVYEWCDDRDTDRGSNCVVRGGSWISAAGIFWASRRGTSAPSYRSNDLGFRVALSSPSGIPKSAEPGD